MKQALLLSILTIFSLTSFSQTGNLNGRIVDAETGKPLVGASVFIIGTYKGAYADASGKYNITGVKAKDYSVKFSIIGYAEKIVNGVSIPSGGSKKLDIQLTPSIKTLNEVEIVGKKNLIDLESGQSSVTIGEEDLAEISVKNVQDVAALQVGVSQNPDGIQIRGGRVYETEYLIDGINAQDPLAGTGFGVDVSASAIKSIEVTTGGSDVEYGSGSSGVVATKIKEGSKKFEFDLTLRRDNLNFSANKEPQMVQEGLGWNTDQVNLSLGGPIFRDKLTFFVSGGMYLSDGYPGPTARQVRSSLFTNDTLWAPRQDNRWTNTVKLTARIRPGLKISLTNQHSLNINQSTRSLQIVGNDEIVTPGFQFPFSLNLDNANTYTHRSNLTVANLTAVLGEQWTMNISVGRLFSNLRTDANGRPFRDSTLDRVYDAFSIVTDPVQLWDPFGTLATDPAVFVFPGPGLVNNGGLASRWHDHYVEEYTFKPKFSFESKNQIHYVEMGWEHKMKEYQWIDVTSPWVGAPIQINDSTTTQSSRLGSSSDFWFVRPIEGGFFVADEIEYKGIIASVGARLNYWAPGRFADEAVSDSLAPVLPQIREDYMNETFGFAGLRWKARLLPRVRVSFPVTDNNVLYFNYGHAMRMPHARFVYAGLDRVFQDRSFLANLGNPNINPEVTVSYEVGLKSQLTKDWALTATAFYNDKFEYIVTRQAEVSIGGQRASQRRFAINQDYARIRGLELSLTRRIGNWFRGTLSGAYQIATGKSNSAAESALQIAQQGFVNTTKEQFLAWDRPFDFKFLGIFTPQDKAEVFGLPLKGFRATVVATYKSGLRYTPFQFVGNNEDTGRPEWERIDDQPFSRVGSPWFWADLKVSRDFKIFNKVQASLTFELKNFTNYRSSTIINGVTGTAFMPGDDVPISARDPRFPDPQDRGTPLDNPARFTAPRQMWLGVQISY
ncbi:MAG: TonB-dependent receptor [Bacteroidia bacterium]|nr:TonB-dependent receptor [Bacteroidia bacterium]